MEAINKPRGTKRVGSSGQSLCLSPELEVVELLVDAILGQQLLMGALFPKAALVHDHDLIGVLNGG